MSELSERYEWCESHQRWLRGEKGGEKADLRKADLHEATLPGANLRGANLREANLREANLRWADLRWADLCWADLCRADLSGVDLRGADLRRADLSGVDLRWADLCWADLRWADLRAAKGFKLLTQTDHGYQVYATWRGKEWRVVAGCRDYSIEEARAHWGADDYHTPSSGQRIVALLDWLERQPGPGGE